MQSLAFTAVMFRCYCWPSKEAVDLFSSRTIIDLQDDDGLRYVIH